MLEVSCWEVSENYLGVALIKSGDSVIVFNEVGCRISCETKRVEPREYSSLSIRQKIERGRFFIL